MSLRVMVVRKIKFIDKICKLNDMSSIGNDYVYQQSSTSTTLVYIQTFSTNIVSLPLLK